MAIREDEIAAKAMGMNTRNMKLHRVRHGCHVRWRQSGVMFASVPGLRVPESFSLMESVMIVAMMVLGGLGHLPGVILGAVLLLPCPRCCATWLGPCTT
jgi:branched-chain amino acid transport system permease protein